MMLVSALVAIGSIFIIICLVMVSWGRTRKKNEEHQQQPTLDPERRQDVSARTDKFLRSRH